MEKTALLAALAAADALPYDELRDVSFDGPSAEPHYRRAVDIVLGLGVATNHEVVDTSGGSKQFETFKACGIEFSSPVGVLAMRDAQTQDAPPIEKLTTVTVNVDGIEATIAGPVAESIREHVLAAEGQRAAMGAASLRAVDSRDDNVVEIDSRRQETAGDPA